MAAVRRGKRARQRGVGVANAALLPLGTSARGLPAAPPFRPTHASAHPAGQPTCASSMLYGRRRWGVPRLSASCWLSRCSEPSCTLPVSRSTDSLTCCSSATLSWMVAVMV